MSNEKPSDTNERGTVYASTSGEETKHQVKTSIKSIVRCKHIHESTKDKKIPQTRNVDLFIYFLLMKYRGYSNGKDRKKTETDLSPF